MNNPISTTLLERIQTRKAAKIKELEDRIRGGEGHLKREQLTLANKNLPHTRELILITLDKKGINDVTRGINGHFYFHHHDFRIQLDHLCTFGLVAHYEQCGKEEFLDKKTKEIYDWRNPTPDLYRKAIFDGDIVRGTLNTIIFAELPANKVLQLEDLNKRIYGTEKVCYFNPDVDLGLLRQ